MHVETQLREVPPSLADVLGGAPRTPLATVGKSGASFERVVLGDAAYVVKYFHPADDWLMHWAGVPGGPVAELWRRGILDLLPDCIDQPIVAVASDGDMSSVLMHDVGPWLIPSDDTAITTAQQDLLLDHMAALHARFWESSLPMDVVAERTRYLELSPAMAHAALARGVPNDVPRLVAEGWPLLPEVAPKLAAVVIPLVHEPGPLLDSLSRTPRTFVHGDWKLDNLGITAEGRTILLDWEMPGRGVATSDLAWYLAINCRRLPGSKESAIATYRDALSRHGVATADWWDRQLGLAMIGALVQLGWEKALGGYDDELAWWEEQVVAAAPLLAG